MVITFETILMLCAAYAPAIAAVLGAVINFIKSNRLISKIMDRLSQMESEITSKEEYKQMKAQFNQVQQENLELKHKMNELLTKIDKIDRSQEV